ncbi:hypothetical protein Tco_1091394 [Tanacetum coccineum]|uniref:Uncharacterized protein n=1 Tax=Tanacetum coccineum TaxID=301880 RepID=A0ABQ5I825_9ASTR
MHCAIVYSESSTTFSNYTNGAIQYKDDHNKIAFNLGRESGSEDFTDILSYLDHSTLRYALTHDPSVVFDSLVKQFWATATVRPNAAGSHDLVATIDGLSDAADEENAAAHDAAGSTAEANLHLHTPPFPKPMPTIPTQSPFTYPNPNSSASPSFTQDDTFMPNPSASPSFTQDDTFMPEPIQPMPTFSQPAIASNNPKEVGKRCKRNTIVRSLLCLLMNMLLYKGMKKFWLVVGEVELTKKMKMTNLKQHFAKFSVTRRRARPDNADNQPKFLRALPSSGRKLLLALKTRGGLESIVLMTLYTKLSSLLELDVRIAAYFHQFLKASGRFLSNLIGMGRISVGDGRNGHKVANGYALLARINRLYKDLATLKIKTPVTLKSKKQHMFRMLGDPRQIMNIGIVDSGCSRSMTGNKENYDDLSGQGRQCQIWRWRWWFSEFLGNVDLYTFSISELQPEQNVTCFVAKASLDKSTRWHRKMAHGCDSFTQKTVRDSNSPLIHGPEKFGLVVVTPDWEVLLLRDVLAHHLILLFHRVQYAFSFEVCCGFYSFLQLVVFLAGLHSYAGLC